MAGANRLNRLSSREALALWGLCQFGGLRSAGPRLTRGGDAGADFAAHAAAVAERFFDGPRRVKYRSLAGWVFAHGQAAGDWVWRQPGETALKARIRIGWAGLNVPDAELGQAVLASLLAEFEAWWRDNRALSISEAPIDEEALDHAKALEERDRRRRMTSAEAATMLGRTPGAVAMLLERGRLKGTKIGGRWETTLGAVWDFMAGHRPRTT